MHQIISRISFCCLRQTATLKSSVTLTSLFLRGFRTSARNLHNEDILTKLKGYYKTVRQIVSKKRMDIVPPGYSLVYRSPLENYVIYGHLGNLFAVGGMLYVGGRAILTDTPFFSYEKYFDESHQFIIGTAFLLGLVVLVQLAYYRSPLRVYFSEKESRFLLVFGSWLPTATKRISVKPGQVRFSGYESAAVPWAPALHTLQGTDNSKRTLLLFSHRFRYPVYYNKLVGVQ